MMIIIPSFACGRRGDPVAIDPYKEIGVVTDLTAQTKDGAVYLAWGIPEGKTFRYKKLKGYVIFRAELPEGVNPDDCKCNFRSLDFIVKESKAVKSLKDGGRETPFNKEHAKTYEYLDRTASEYRSYLYKIIVMDTNNMMGEDSNIALVKGIKPEAEKPGLLRPEAPTGLLGIYTNKSVILTWNEIIGQRITLYRVYRSEGEDFVSIGETSTPAFTDTTIQPSVKYYYKVHAVGDIEGLPSAEVEIITKETR
jgi:hypothetical protein